MTYPNIQIHYNQAGNAYEFRTQIRKRSGKKWYRISIISTYSNRDEAAEEELDCLKNFISYVYRVYILNKPNKSIDSIDPIQISEEDRIIENTKPTGICL